MASLLGLFQGNASRNASHDPTKDDGVKATRSAASCCGHSRPDPAVRLRLSEDATVRIFGFPYKDLPESVPLPFPSFGNGGSPLLYLRGDVPAYVTYVMGQDWQDSLRSDHHTNRGHQWHDGEVIIRPGLSSDNETTEEDLESNEEIHCVRMRRCGAIAIRSESDAVLSAMNQWEDIPKQTFGWPSHGGGWVLQYPGLDVTNETDVWARDREVMDDLTLAEMHYQEVRSSLSQYADMDELCRALQNAGADYYAAVEDCPQVMKLGLHLI